MKKHNLYEITTDAGRHLVKATDKNDALLSLYKYLATPEAYGIHYTYNEFLSSVSDTRLLPFQNNVHYLGL
jgi:hypothetical protein